MRARRAAAGIIEINISIPAKLVKGIDRWAKKTGVSRSPAAAELITLGIKAAKMKGKG